MPIRISLVFESIVRVGDFYRIRAFLENLGEKRLCALLRLVRHDGGVELSGEVIYGYKEVFSCFLGRFPRKEGKAFGVKMHHLSRILLVVALGFFLKTLLNALFNLGEASDTVLEASEPLVGTPVDRKVLLFPSSENLVYRWPGYAVLSRKIALSDMMDVVVLVHLLSL